MDLQNKAPILPLDQGVGTSGISTGINGSVCNVLNRSQIVDYDLYSSLVTKEIN